MFQKIHCYKLGGLLGTGTSLLQPFIGMTKFFRIKMFNPSEEEITFDSFVKFPLLCYRMLLFEFEPLTLNAGFFERLKHSMKINFCRLVLFAYIIAMLSMCLYVITAENFLSGAANIPNIVGVVLVCSKIATSLFHRKDIWRIFEDLRVNFAARGNQNAKYKVKEYLDGYHFFIKLFASSMVIMFSSVAQPIMEYLFNGTMKLTVSYWYPFDPFQPTNFPYVLFWVDFIAGTCLLFTTAADSLFYGLITVIAMEFDILRQDLTNIKLTQKHRRADEVKSLVERHNKVLKICDDLQNIYKENCFMTLVISSLWMCFLAFMLSTAKDFEAYSFYIPYLTFNVLELLLFCVYGQKILDSSTTVADGIYNCGWEDFDDISLKKQLVLLVQRAQRPKKLSAMGFADVTHECFTSVRSMNKFFF